jgi:hypothetical protein
MILFACNKQAKRIATATVMNSLISVLSEQYRQLTQISDSRQRKVEL